MISYALIAAADTQAFHQFGRLQSLTEWWQWFLLAAICAAILGFIVVMYWKDCVELSRGTAWGLCLLRAVALLGVLFFFLDLEKREERKLIRNSRAIVLVDTSLSMGIQDDRGSAAPSSSSGRRIDAVIDEFARGTFLTGLRDQHDVIVYRFDQQTVPIEVASFPRVARAGESVEVDQGAEQARNLRESRTIAAIAAIMIAVSLVSAVVYRLAGRGRSAALSGKPLEERDGSWSLLVSMVSLIAGIVVLGVSSLRHPELEFAAILGLRDPSPVESLETPDPQANPDNSRPAVPSVAWSDALAPRGVETRIGDVIRAVVGKERGGPIAGLVLASDGGNNAGSDISEGIAAARSAGIPVFTVGLGSDRRPTNVRIVDMEVPPRVFPGDAFPITGFLQAFNLAGRSVKVELTSSAGESRDPNVERVIEESRQVTLGQDGELISLQFEVTPQQPGVRNYQLRVVPPQQDVDDRDNERSAAVQVVERKNRVLLFAGAAMRDYQLLRNLLYRDKETTVDVLLQSGSPGISQESNELLFEFPQLAEELFAYDVIVAFDPDWTQLDDLQVELLERWVAEKAGGLVVVAGTVGTAKLTSSRAGDARLATLRGLYPVVFFGRSSAAISLSRTASETPWPLQFTRDGQEAEFLRLEDDPLESERAWASYPGVFGYFAVKDVKPGAKIFARFSDPSTAVDNTLPVYLAAQFYGAGRVVYQGSGEMWRLRQGSDAYFDRYYTKLIRWVSQGRLLRDSSRGVLLADKDRCLLGDTITVQGILNDSQHQPLTAGEVTAVLVDPDGRRSSLTLRRIEDAARPGMYSAQFTAALEGDYRVELALPNASEQELLTREVRSRIPALETERPERNDPLLVDLAEKTDGEYFIGFDAALNRGTGRTPLATLLEPQDQTTFLPGTPDKDFDRLLMTWLMGIICGALCLEWLFRRLNKLA
jgi:hypothetical protein